MPEKSQKRKLRSDLKSSHSDVQVASFYNEENRQLSERDFEDISNKIENKISRRLRDAELGQRENLGLIEYLSSKVNSLSRTSCEQACSASVTENNGNVVEALEEVSQARNVNSKSAVSVSLEFL